MTEPTYFGTPNEPYEPPPDRPYEPPPDRPYESPPVQPYQPPPDQPPPDLLYESPPVQPPPDLPYESPPVQPPPDQPPPDQPPPDQPPPDQPRQLQEWRRWLKIGVIPGVTLLVAIAIAHPADIFSFLGNSSDPGKSSDPAYGRNPVDVVHELHICDNPTVDQGMATCTLPDGIGYAIVVTANNKYEQDAIASDAKDPAEGCTMVVKGYFVTGPDRATLIQALGNLDAFAANHHGYLEGGCS